MELLSDIVALAMQVQEAFATAQSPQAKAAILTEFGNSLGLRLAAFDPGLDENALTMAVQNLRLRTSPRLRLKLSSPARPHSRALF
jgi:hypothetical protein